MGKINRLYIITIGHQIMLCPCGSQLTFSACCQPFITSSTSGVFPSTPEQLMRSRFSAYAIKDALYIFNTYGKEQQLGNRLEDIQSWADECHWMSLIVHNTTEETVEFSAFFIIDDTLCELKEVSNFTQEQVDGARQWRYIDGTIITNTELAKIKRNQLCPCNQYPSSWSAKKGKKYKHCCGK